MDAEQRDELGRDYYARGAPPGHGYRNVYRRGKLRTGLVEYAAPQVAGCEEPFRSRVAGHLKGNSEVLEDLAIEMLARGLSVSDGAPGITKAVETCFPRSARLRCLAHRIMDLAPKVAEDLWPDFQARATAAHQAASRAIARNLAEGVVRAVACFMDDIEACIAHMDKGLARDYFLISGSN